jgi:hypothetical protein
MSELRLETLTMPTAQVWPENPPPPLFTVAYIHASIDTVADAEMRRNIGYGRVGTVLPYLDDYGRSRRPAEHKVAVLENDVMGAHFLLDRAVRPERLTTGRARRPSRRRRRHEEGTRPSQRPTASSGRPAAPRGLRAPSRAAVCSRSRYSGSLRTPKKQVGGRR